MKTATSYRSTYFDRIAHKAGLHLATRIVFAALLRAEDGTWRPADFEEVVEAVQLRRRRVTLDDVHDALETGARLGFLDRLSTPEEIVLAGCGGES